MSGKRGVSGVYGARGGNGAGLMGAGEAHGAAAVTAWGGRCLWQI